MMLTSDLCLLRRRRSVTAYRAYTLVAMCFPVGIGGGGNRPLAISIPTQGRKCAHPNKTARPSISPSPLWRKAMVLSIVLRTAQAPRAPFP